MVEKEHTSIVQKKENSARSTGPRASFQAPTPFRVCMYEPIPFPSQHYSIILTIKEDPLSTLCVTDRTVVNQPCYCGPICHDLLPLTPRL